MGKNTPESGTITRRAFLKRSAMAAGATVLGSATLAHDTPRHSPPHHWDTVYQPPPQTDSLLIIPDAHLIPGNDEWNRLREVVLNYKDLPLTLVVQLGDLIGKEEGEPLNMSMYTQGVQQFQEFVSPVIHLLGNHDLWGIRPEMIATLFAQLGLDNPMYGVKQFDGYQVVWPDLICPPGSHGIFPEERVEWLRSVIGRTPTILCYHYSLVLQNSENHYHFNHHPHKTAIQNPEVWEKIKDLPIRAVVSGHMHRRAHFWKDGILHVSLPSFKTEPYALGQHTILEATPRTLVFRNFHQEYSSGYLEAVC